MSELEHAEDLLATKPKLAREYIEKNNLINYLNIKYKLFLDCFKGMDIYELFAKDTIIIINNNLYEIPQAIGKLKKLKYIDFSKNKIQDVPKELFDLPNLENLFFKKKSHI
jgi:hypothetical protein